MVFNITSKVRLGITMGRKINKTKSKQTLEEITKNRLGELPLSMEKKSEKIQHKII